MLRVILVALFLLRNGWSHLFESLDGALEHTVMIAVKQSPQGLQSIKEFVDSRYRDPLLLKTPHLTRQQVADMTNHAASTAKVLEYLDRHNIKVIKKSTFGEYIHASAPISMWEKVFSTTFHAIKSSDGKMTPQAREITMPAELNDHISTIFHTTQKPFQVRKYAPQMRRLEKPSLRASSTGYVTPALINSHYHIESNLCDSKATQAVYASLGQSFSPNDIHDFLDSIGAANINLKVTATDGHASSSECVAQPENCAEANLDTEYILSICQGTSTSFYYDESGDFLDWIYKVADERHPAYVQSISYGADESDVPQEYSDQFECEAAKLVAQGVTIVVASGDDGVSSPYAQEDRSKCGYNPSYPATSQYVTAVGGTFGPEHGDAEVACQSDLGGAITSGGGFSTLVAQPDWQTDAVDQYFDGLKSDQTPMDGFGSGRAIPDVSLLAHDYLVTIGGEHFLVSGTSASTPVFSAMVSLVNTERLKSGLPSIGLLNRRLYENSQHFANDIITGSNFCTASRNHYSAPTCCNEGFYATKGWDPVTGVGSVDFAKFVAILSKD